MDRPGRNRNFRGKTIALAIVLAVGKTLLAGGVALAQQPAMTSAQRAFRVQHIDLQTAAVRVRTMLGDASGAAVFVDADTQRLLVQGSPAQLDQVERLLSELDRPAAAPGSAAAEIYLNAYPVAADRRARIEQWLADYQPPEGARLALDARTDQLLVMGPPALHQLAQTQIDHTGNNVAPPQPDNGTHAATTTPHVAAENAARVVLQHTTGDLLHRRLEQLLSRRLPMTTDNTGQWLAFQAGLTPGAEVKIEAHRTTGHVQLSGSPEQVAGWARVLRAVDTPAVEDDAVTQLVSPKPASALQVRQTLKVLEAHAVQPAAVQPQADEPATMILQPRGQPQDLTRPEADTQDPGDEETAEDREGALLGPVRVEFIEGLDIIVIRGNRRDVERVQEIINRIEQVSAETIPAIEVLPLQHVDSESMARLLVRVYSQVLGPRTGTVSVTPLGKPNSLLLIGRPENVNTAIDLVKRVDVPVEPSTRYEVFPLKSAVAGDVKQIIDAFLAEQEDDVEDLERGALQPRAMVVADFRTNSLIVNAAPRDLAEITVLIKQIDVDRAAAVDEVRIFPLRNTTATELAEVLRGAVLAREEGDVQQDGGATSARVSALRFVTVDPDNPQPLESGILANIRISADTQTNSLVVTAPAESMELIAALIRQLDRTPDAEAEIKVFTIVNGDAVSLVDMLRTLFGAAEGEAGPTGLGGGENALVRLQFSVDERTNSIIAAGTQQDLAVVYAILLQLDEGDVRQRETRVHRLKNAPAEEVGLALNELLRTEREAEVAANLAISPFEQIEREVIIVPEIVSNSLIVSATPRFIDKITNLIEELDERPAMVMIQVLIAEVRLNDTDEFGVELGLQDSILFDRSVLDLTNFQTITNTMQTQSPGGATVSTTDEVIVNSPLVPGFGFNNQPLGNNGSASALATAGTVATQGLSNFALNRINPDLGFGGFVFSASSNSVSALLRALQESRRLEVLSRPQIAALDNQEAIIRVGQRVPTIQNVNITQFGQQNQVTFVDVGINLSVRPRISPDGMVVMELQAEKSQVGSEAEGIPIFAGVDGTVIRQPRIDQVVAFSTVAAASGQTIVLSGLMTKETFDVHRRVPILSEIPLLGDLFRFDAVSQQRTELLLILTPRVMRSPADAEMIKQVESSRMSWVLGDVVQMHGPSGLRGRGDEWTATDCETVYPGHVHEQEFLRAGEVVPTPSPVETLPFVPQEEEPLLLPDETLLDNPAQSQPVRYDIGQSFQVPTDGDSSTVNQISYQQTTAAAPPAAAPARLLPPITAAP